jgi:hypothetical protein
MQQYEKFLPNGFYRMSVEERRAARTQAHADWQAWKAQRKIELVAEKAAKAATQMTCQVCARPIFAETGLIAHHGYQRPYEGVQTASCHGARHMPFECSKDALEQEIELVQASVDKLAAHIAEVEAERRSIYYVWTSKEYNSILRTYIDRGSNVTRANFDEVIAVIRADARFFPGVYNFDRLKADELRKLGGRLERMQRYLTEQRTRAATWKQTHRLGAGNEQVWVAL